MPTVDDNKKIWDGDYQWTNRGDEWSVAWGGPYMQWYGAILPRIHRYLPTGNILEIACGYGRWTQFLKDVCKNIVAIDLSEECIDACRQRFSNCSHIDYHVNDGKSLQMIPDASIDFVFSFDSLVHADEPILDAYLSQLPRILKSEGAAFIHHSNLGEYKTLHSKIGNKPKLRKFITMLGMFEENLHLREPSVSAVLVEQLAEEHGLQCVSQELIPWGTKRLLIDGLSTIVKAGSLARIENKVFRNVNFMREASYLEQLSRLYSLRKNDN